MQRTDRMSLPNTPFHWRHNPLSYCCSVPWNAKSVPQASMDLIAQVERWSLFQNTFGSQPNSDQRIFYEDAFCQTFEGDYEPHADILLVITQIAFVHFLSALFGDDIICQDEQSAPEEVPKEQCLCASETQGEQL